MFSYNKFLEFPVKVSKPNPRLANVVITQYGGPNGELGASLRYLSQRYTMPDEVSKGLLTDIGTEELAHLEIVGSLVAQLSKNAPPKEWSEMGSWEYYSDNGASVFPQSSQGSPFNAASIACWVGSPEPQCSDKRWFSRFFYLLTAYWRGHGRKDILECYEV